MMEPQMENKKKRKQDILRTKDDSMDRYPAKVESPPPPPPSPAEPKEKEGLRPRPILSAQLLAALQHHPLPVAPAPLDALVDTLKSNVAPTPPPTPALQSLDLPPSSGDNMEADERHMDVVEPPTANPALYKSSESVPVLYEPDRVAIKREEDLVHPQANETRETSLPTASLYV